MYEGKPDNRFSSFLRRVEVIEDKQSHVCFDTCPLFLHVDTKLLTALAVEYDEILQALQAGGDVLLSKPLLDPGFVGVFRRNSQLQDC